MDLARRGTAAAAAGFVNFMGYMGAAAGDKVTGHLAQDYGWPFAVRFWAACAFAGALVIAFLWNTGRSARRRGESQRKHCSEESPTSLAELRIMRAIIIGAGRGRRLMPTTADTPKCFAEVQGRRLLDWALDAFAGAASRDICFIGGYQIEKVQRDYPHFTFRHNADWENNNILLSLMHAEDLMERRLRLLLLGHSLHARRGASGCCEHPADIALSVDTRWLDRYQHRTQHPPDDAEKVTVRNGLRDARPSRHPAARGARRIHRHREVHRRRRGAAARAFSPRAARSSPASRFARRRSSRRRI